MRSSRLTRAAGWTGCLIALGGCAAVGPNYVRPQLEAPARFSEGQAGTQAKPAAEREPILAQTAWWKEFGDAELDSLVERAVKSNLDLAQARARVVQARASVKTSKAALAPSVTASGSVTGADYGANAGVIASSTFTAGFDASWELDVFGGARRSVEASRASLQATEEALHDTLLTLLGDVATYYLGLRANQEQLAIARSTVTAREETLALTTEKFKLGLTHYLDVAEAQALRDSAKSAIPTYQANIQQYTHRIGILLGLPPRALQDELSASAPLPKVNRVLATGLPSDLLARRPDLRKAERDLATASANIGVATAELYPKFDLTLGLGLQSSSASTFAQSASHYLTIVPGISLPIFDGGKRRATIEGKRAAYDESLAKYRATFHSALEDVENALTKLYAEQEKHQLLKDTVNSYETALKLSTERYRKGLITLLDVLDLQRSYDSARTSLSQSEADQLTDLVTLYKALGGGWEAKEVAVADREVTASGE